MKYHAKKSGQSGAFIQKSVTVMLASLMLTSVLTGCGKSGNPDNPGADNSQSVSNTSNSGGKSNGASALDISFDHSYSSEEVKLDGIKGYGRVQPMGDSFFISAYDENYEEKLVLYHPADNSTQEVKLAYPETLDDKTECYTALEFVNADGNLAVVFNSYIWDEENEEEPYKELGYTMEVYDTSMNVLETKDVNDMFNAGTYFQSLLYDPSDSCYYAVANDNMGSTILAVYDKDFHKTGDINGEFQYIESMFLAKDNTICVKYQDSEWNSRIGKINPESKTLESIEIVDMPAWINGAFAGNDQYEVYFYDSNSIYGVDSTNGKCEEVVNFLNSDFMGESINFVTTLSDDRFLISTYDYDGSGDAGMYILSARDPKEFENVQMITMATFGLSSSLGRAVRNFNRQNSGYRIGILDYNKYSTEEDWEAGMTKFENDMTSGIVADIICTSGISYEKFANKGIFLDLSEYISTLNPDDYFMNAFEALRYGDTLNQIGFSYSVQTLQAKTEFVGDRSGISVSEYINLIKTLPADMQAFSEMTQSSAMYTLCMGNLNAFIDVAKATCTFNTPEFVQLLELCKTYPADADSMNDKTDEEWDAYWQEYDFQYINNKTLFQQAYISDVKQALNDRCQYFDKADVNYIGYPTLKENSNGGKFQFDYTLAVSANSGMKDQIFGLFTEMLSEESQEKLSWQLPVNKKAFDTKATKALEPDTYVDENGETQIMPLMIWRGEENIEYDLPTRQDIDEIKNYVAGVTETNYYDNQIYTIIQEETEKFFSGDQTAQAAADMIQSRASLYLSEQS